MYWEIYLNGFHFDIHIGISLFLLPDDSYFHMLSFFLQCIHLLLSIGLYFSVLEICTQKYLQIMRA